MIFFWNTKKRNYEAVEVYHKLGNIGFLAFSGAAGFEETKPYFEEAVNIHRHEGYFTSDFL